MTTRYVKAAQVARQLGIPRRTVSGWCLKERKLAIKRGHDYFLDLEQLARKPGLDPVKIRVLLHHRAIKAVQLAQLAGLPRRTISRWCKERPHLAFRIGRVWYLDLSALGATDEQLEALATRPENKAALRKVLEVLQPEPEAA